MKKLWFKAKKYGYGWYPCTWHGWFITLVYIFLILFIFRIVDLGSQSVSDTLIGMLIPFFVITLIFIFICIKTGEKAKWRWN